MCRQYWAEASQAFFSSYALVVDSNPTIVFPSFVQISGPIVSQIRRLIVHSPRVSLGLNHNFPLCWYKAFKTVLVGRLTSLEGVSISGTLSWIPEGDPTATDFMRGHFVCRDMATTVRSFQQHKLKEELTTVDFQPDDWMMHRAAAFGPVNDAIRERLLRYCPLRRSERKV